jgi:hypothetical protein
MSPTALRLVQRAQGSNLASMPVDPAPFLSTIILASAGLVAIVGGLLVARFVSLDSDQQASRNVLTEGEQRLATAQRRQGEAWTNLVSWHAWDFLADKEVREAIGQGITNLAELRKLEDCRLGDDDLALVVNEASAEFAAARAYMSSNGIAEQIEAADYDWNVFRRAVQDLPAQRWPLIWRDVFNEAAETQKAEAAERRRAEIAALRRTNPLAASMMASFPDSWRPPLMVPARTDYESISARREDELVAADQRALQRVEDSDEELQRLRAAHAEIVRPDSRLWWGVAILVCFAIVGVGIPAWLMAFGPNNLSSVRWVFYPFAAVLAALLFYIGIYLFKLTRQKKARPGQADATHT